MESFNLKNQMGKSSTLFFLLLLLPMVICAQPDELKRSESITLDADTWTLIHEHSNVSFTAQLASCDTRQIAKFKVANRSPKLNEVRVSFVNGSKRLGTQLLILQPLQEIELNCTGSMGVAPIFLVEGTTVRVETQVIQRN